MSIHCPHCNRAHAISAFRDTEEITCTCGAQLTLTQDPLFKQLSELARTFEADLEEDQIRAVQGAADTISKLITTSDLPLVDIEIEKEKLRTLIKTHFPDKAYLYELIYESRFKRLWEQFRTAT